MTTINSAPSKYVRDYDPDAPTSLELTKLAWEMDIRDPEAMNLNIYLATRFSGTSLSGVINPEDYRIRHQLGIDTDTMAGAVAHLIKSGAWKVSFKTSKRVAFPGIQAESLPAHEEQQNFDLMSQEDIKQALLNRGLDSIDRYTPTFIEQARREKPRLKKVKVSFNHLRLFSRYAPGLRGLSRTLADMAAMSITPTYNDFGFYDHGKSPLNYNYGKICHSVWFHSPMMAARTVEEVQELAAVKVLTDDMVSKPFWTRISFDAIAAKFDLGSNPTKAITDAVRQLQNAGWFRAGIELGDGSGDFGLNVLLEPTKKTHDVVWDFELHPGGHAQTEWETRHGHNPPKPLVEGPDPYENLPKLGYHWLYLLKSEKSGKYLTVGQTTTPLRVRLNQHQAFGSNRAVDAAIRAINGDPTDRLAIEYIGQVHYVVCSQYEMRALAKMAELGHELFNNLDNADENYQTIHLDKRFAAYTPWKQQQIRAQARDRYGDVIDLQTLPVPLKSSEGASVPGKSAAQF
jgi:hypothetical protein